jgi:hypothetical protein
MRLHRFADADAVAAFADPNESAKQFQQKLPQPTNAAQTGNGASAPATTPFFAPLVSSAPVVPSAPPGLVPMSGAPASVPAADPTVPPPTGSAGLQSVLAAAAAWTAPAGWSAGNAASSAPAAAAQAQVCSPLSSFRIICEQH